ncbi:MAG: hypothetical protein ACRDZ7_01275 [Acidimicrobiia bacterium]
MDRDAPTARDHRGTAIICFKAGLLAREANQRWFIRGLQGAGWPRQAIATYLGLPRERVDQIVTGTDDVATYLASLSDRERDEPGLSPGSGCRSG